jgi:hypothetical protein
LTDLPNQLIDSTLLVAWRAWFARNESTHDKPLPSVEGSKRFMCNYVNLTDNVSSLSTDQILKGKQLEVVSEIRPASTIKVCASLDKPWIKSPSAWVELTVDGSYKAENAATGAGMVCQNK